MVGTAGPGQVLNNTIFLAADRKAILVEEHTRPIQLQLHERGTNRSPQLTDLSDPFLPDRRAAPLLVDSSDGAMQTAEVCRRVDDRHPDQPTCLDAGHDSML